ncbi:hypothetical protein NMY22_g15909 [Coprinellus aureogranulatus]|nr:hypothetical protein NMY22_g15909 [Coprinellus aureogranulatus]
MSKSVALLAVLGFVSASPVQQLSLSKGTAAEPLDPYPGLGKPRLTFKPDGTFKITVFSDLHFGENPWDWWGPLADIRSINLMNRVLGDEKPDYAVINGDLITGENTFKENATTLIDQIVGPFNTAGVPFSSSHGNHDNQKNITHREEILREQQVAPLSYTRFAPDGVGGQDGPGNYWVPVSPSLVPDKEIKLMEPHTMRLQTPPRHSSYGFSILEVISAFISVLSNRDWVTDYRGIGGFTANETSTPVPDWVDASVAEWVEEQTGRMEEEWGPSESRGALAFTHIPPHAILKEQDDVDEEKNPGLNEDTLGQGSVQSSSDETFWNTVTSRIKNLHAIISGHDHGNEWCIRESTKDVIFCFNKHSGYGGYGESWWGYGVRNIVFSSSDPSVPAQTWIRLEAGETRAHITLDDSYGR